MSLLSLPRRRQEYGKFNWRKDSQSTKIITKTLDDGKTNGNINNNGLGIKGLHLNSSGINRESKILWM